MQFPFDTDVLAVCFGSTVDATHVAIYVIDLSVIVIEQMECQIAI